MKAADKAVTVAKVAAGSAGEKAGLKAGDVVLEAGAEDLTGGLHLVLHPSLPDLRQDEGELVLEVTVRPVGDPLQVTVH